MSSEYKGPSELRGYVALSLDTTHGAGVGFGGYSRQHPDKLRRRHPNDAIVNVKRARDVARRFHDWDIPSEDELIEAAMAGH